MYIEFSGGTVKVPDFLIVGAAKAGTTSLHHYLKQHPDVFMPTPKEPFFFSFMNNPPSYNGPNRDSIISDPDEYCALFESAPEKSVYGECSNSYLYQYEDTIQNIQAFYGDQFRDVRIVIVLRNPVERTFSMYEMLKNRGVEELDFDDAVSPETIQARLADNYSLAYDYLGWGMYYEQVRAYRSAFPRCRIYLSEDLKSATADLMDDLFTFIGVDPCDTIDYSIKYNLSGRHRNTLLGTLTNQLGLMDGLKRPFIRILGQKRFRSMTYRIKKSNLQRGFLQDYQREYLGDYFRQDVGRLAGLLNRDLQGWLK